MRLWHYKLISKLPQKQLCGQHRECCALRGNGWGKKNSVVNYVFNYSPLMLWNYHVLVMTEMKRRGYKPNQKWLEPGYRGKDCFGLEIYSNECEFHKCNYPEHDELYYNECLANLLKKGIEIK